LDIGKQSVKGCEPIEDLNDQMKNHTHFIGFKIGHLLKDASLTFIQEFLPIHREFRIECIGGECPENAIMEDSNRGGGDSDQVVRRDRKTIHKFFMNCIDSLPETLRGLPLTADPAILKDGKLITFETNPGGNGYTIHHEKTLVSPHNKAIKRYIDLVSKDSLESPIHQGMSLENQIIYLDNMMKKWNVSYQVNSPRYHTILPDRILSSQIALTTLKLERFNQKVQYLTPKVVSREVKDISIEKGLKYVLANLQIFASPKSALDLCHAISNFAYMRKTLKPSSYELILNIKKELQENYQKVMVTKFMNTLNTVKLPKGKRILSQTMKKKVANAAIKIIEEMGELQILDIEHSEIRKKMNEFFTILYYQDMSDWNTLFFKGFDVLGVKKFDLLVKKLNGKYLSKSEKRNTIIRLTKYCKSISDLFGLVPSIDRTGYKIPGFSSEGFLKMWTPRIRQLYKLFLFDDESIKGEKIKKEAFLQLAYAVTHLIFACDDYSLLKLSKEQYLPEYEYLKETARISSLIGENDINGEVIDCLLLLGANNDTSMESTIQENQFFLVLKQSDTGAWRNFGKPDIHAINTAVTGLVDHEYALEGPKEFGKVLSFDDWKEKLNMLGLNLNHQDYFFKRPKHPNYEKFKKIVKKSFAKRGLIEFFNDE
jgi:hypothetical protein